MRVEVATRSASRKAFIASTAQVYIDSLKLAESKYKVNIVSVPGLVKNHRINGSVHLSGDKELTMQLDSRLGIIALCQTMAHEFVHIKQHAKGQLVHRVKRSGKSEFVWRGKIHQNDMFDAPWEIEAYSRERLLSNEILKVMLE